MQLSEHFSLAELTRTSQPYSNVPTDREIANLRLVCEHILEPVRAHFGKPIRVNSGFRGAKVNAAVGSKPTSQHRLGEAVDFEIDGVTNHDIACYVRDHIQFDQVILENYKPGLPGSGWVHASYRQGRLRKNALTMILSSHGPVYKPGIVV